MVRDRPGEVLLTSMSTPSSIEDFYRLNWGPLVRLALILTGDRGKAEDIVHDVFLRLATRPSPRDPKSYLRTMVVNATRDHHRRVKVERKHIARVPSPAMPPEVDEMIQHVQRLPMRQRQALALRFYVDLSVEQIADVMSCPPGTVKSLIHRGIESLRKEIGYEPQ